MYIAKPMIEIRRFASTTFADFPEARKELTDLADSLESRGLIPHELPKAVVEQPFAIFLKSKT